MENIVKQGKNTIIAHLKHLKGHGEMKLYQEASDYLKNNNIINPLEEVKENKMETEEKLPCGCPSSKVMDLRDEDKCEGHSTAIKEDAKTVSDDKASKIEQLIKELNVKESKLRQWPVSTTMSAKVL